MKAQVLLLAGVATLAAQSDDAALRRMRESQRQVTTYLEKAAREVTNRAGAEIPDRKAWESVRAERLAEMQDMLGLLPLPARTPLNARVTGTLDQGEYVIEKLVFESLPKIYVTGSLYLPKRREGRLPAIVYVCGHAVSPYGDKTKYQRHGISFAKNGYVALILDSIQIAETFALHHGVSSQEMYEWYARGYTPAGVEVWNAMRAIDYLETRPEVDAARIGMTGRSGGAAMSWFTAAVDQRVRVVAPVMGISTYAANLRENTQRLHCDCMFAINSRLHDMMHQGALIAPRPLLMMHGRKDALFPVAGYEEFQRTVGALYRSYDRETFFRNIVVDTGHQDSDYLREQAVGWFDRHLRAAPERKLDMSVTELPEEKLAVFPAGPPADARNHVVHETFLPTPEFRTFANLAAWEQRRRELLERVRANVFGAFPKTAPPLAARTLADGEIEFTSEDGITLRALRQAPGQRTGRLPGLLYIASDGDDPRAVRELLRGVRTRANGAALAVYPRGIGEIPWEKSFWKDTLRNSMHVGRSIDSMRLWDVLRAAELLRSDDAVDPDRIMVLGKGISGALGLWAAILDPRIQQVMLIQPPSSHVEGPLFLNVLRFTDLPEAAALLAPRRLNFYSRMPAAYEATRRVYDLYQKGDHMFTGMSIEGVLEGRYDHRFSSGN